MTDLQLELKMIKSVILNGIIGCESHNNARLSILDIRSSAAHIYEICTLKKKTKIDLTLKEVEEIIKKIQEWSESEGGKADGTSSSGSKIAEQCEESILNLRKYCK